MQGMDVEAVSDESRAVLSAILLGAEDHRSGSARAIASTPGSLVFQALGRSGRSKNRVRATGTNPHHGMVSVTNGTRLTIRTMLAGFPHLHLAIN
jgi:hypothetical protein